MLKSSDMWSSVRILASQDSGRSITGRLSLIISLPDMRQSKDRQRRSS